MDEEPPQAVVLADGLHQERYIGKPEASCSQFKRSQDIRAGLCIRDRAAHGSLPVRHFGPGCRQVFARLLFVRKAPTIAGASVPLRHMVRFYPIRGHSARWQSDHSCFEKRRLIYALLNMTDTLMFILTSRSMFFRWHN